MTRLISNSEELSIKRACICLVAYALVPLATAPASVSAAADDSAPTLAQAVDEDPAGSRIATDTAEPNGEDEANDVVMEEMVVTAFRRDYRSNAANSAIGLPFSLKETPAAISVVTQDILQDQQVNDVDDALRNVAGVTKFKTGNGGEERFAIRGFDASQSIYKDGARINNAFNASNIPSTETANLERIDVLKGPSALLYGQGEPGGIINYIVKKPESESHTELELLGGNNDFKRFEFDTTDAFPGSDSFAYRLVGAYEDSGSFRDEVFRERLLVNPSLSWRGNRANLLIGYEFIEDKFTQDRGQVLDGNTTDGFSYSARLSPGQFFGIPNFNRNSEAESERIYVLAGLSLFDRWNLDLQYNNTQTEKLTFDSSPQLGFDGSFFVVGPAGTSRENWVTIQPRQSFGSGSAEQFWVKNTFDFGVLGTRHNLLLSLTQEEFASDRVSFVADRNVIFDVATGEYFNDPDDSLRPPGAIQATPSVSFSFSEGDAVVQDLGLTRERGINLVDMVELNDRWKMLLGARFSAFENISSGIDDENLSFRGGIVRNVGDSASTYVSYSEGYTSAANLEGRDGTPVDPETSNAWEIGAKYIPSDGRFLVTATLFRVDLQDVPFLVEDETTGLDFWDNIGGVRSQGLEVELVGNLNDRWRITAGYSYIDNTLSEDGQGEFADFERGNRLPGVGEHNINLFTFYEIPLGSGVLGLGGGLFYQSEAFQSFENRGEFDAWTQVDAAAYYAWRSWKLQFNVRNLTDENYLLAQSFAPADEVTAIRVDTAAPRTFTLSLAYEFSRSPLELFRRRR
ncbi:MAG: TonB-dependent receptor plug domain-containing protein [Pseudomonadota bacterium]